MLTEHQRKFLEYKAKHTSKAELEKQIHAADYYNQPLFNKMVRELIRA